MTPKNNKMEKAPSDTDNEAVIRRVVEKCVAKTQALEREVLIRKINGEVGRWMRKYEDMFWVQQNNPWMAGYKTALGDISLFINTLDL